MNQYDGSGGDDQSEDGLLGSPDNDLISNEEDTTDSLDIKPPQATKGEPRYKVKKSGKEKKLSKDDRHKERERIKERVEHREQRHHGGERIGVDNRHHGIKPTPGKFDREQIRYDTTYMHQQREREHYSNHKERVNNREKFKEREQQKLDKGHQRHDRKKSSAEKSESDRALEDLRSRLLSKRNKLETERRAEDQRILINEDHYEYRRLEKDMNRFEYEIERRKEKDSIDRRNEYYQHMSRDHRERKDIIELIDSPENYNDIPSQSKMIQKDNRRGRSVLISYTEDKEQAARRAKLLEAEREMARRKILFREELEARRELRRERNETRKSNPSTVTEKKRKRQISFDETEEYKKLRDNDLLNIDKDFVVTVTDNSEEDTESDSDTTTNSEAKDISDGELPGSPLSIGELTKSDLRRRSNSRSVSRSRSHSISSQSQSRSVSRSKSKSISPSTQQYRRQMLLYNSNSQSSPHSRSKSKSPIHQFIEDYDNYKVDSNVDKNNKVTTIDNIVVDNKNKENTLSNIEEEEVLPSYFPALQGCRSVEEFQCLNRIEEGTYGVVYRAKDKRTEEIVALKRLKMEKEKEGFPITSLREINTLLKGQHPNIVTVREIVVGSNMDKIFIVMDYVEHDLKSLMETMKHKKQAFLPGEVKCLLQQLLRAVAHLHDNWILHRDLKTSNLLLSHKGILKVGDFGLAREYGSPLKAYTSIVVTLWYRAPELLLCCKEYSTPIDIWSVGCIFAELMSMTALFPGKSEIDQLNRIFKDLGTPNDKIWIGYNELPAVQKMTFTEYPVSQLRKKFAHLTSELGLSLLQGLLTYDPKQRLTADQGLRHNYFKELPLPIDPGMFPTWPAKSELGVRKALASSPKPPSGGGQFKQLVDDASDNHGFNLGSTNMIETRQIVLGGGFSLKF